MGTRNYREPTHKIIASPSSRGLGPSPFKAVTAVRIRLGIQSQLPSQTAVIVVDVVLEVFFSELVNAPSPCVGGGS